MITQEQFDTVYNGLAAQNWEHSRNRSGGFCSYRSSDGKKKCAIGHLIPDDRYDPAMEGNGLFEFQELGLLLDMDDAEFDELQSAHDGAADPDDMRRNFDNLRVELNLS